jgi:hypothetical protein
MFAMESALLHEAMEDALVSETGGIAEVTLDPLPALEQLQILVQAEQADLAHLGRGPQRNDGYHPERHARRDGPVAGVGGLPAIQVVDRTATVSAEPG